MVFLTFISAKFENRIYRGAIEPLVDVFFNISLYAWNIILLYISLAFTFIILRKFGEGSKGT